MLRPSPQSHRAALGGDAQERDAQSVLRDVQSFCGRCSDVFDSDCAKELRSLLKPNHRQLSRPRPTGTSGRGVIEVYLGPRHLGRLTLQNFFSAGVAWWASSQWPVETAL